MKTTTHEGHEIEIYHAGALTAGYGHKKITVELRYKDQNKTFAATTNNMPDYDAMTEIEDLSDKHIALYNLIRYQIADEVTEWIDAINYK
jgi:hypothetical protein